MSNLEGAPDGGEPRRNCGSDSWFRSFLGAGFDGSGFDGAGFDGAGFGEQQEDIGEVGVESPSWKFDPSKAPHGPWLGRDDLIHFSPRSLILQTISQIHRGQKEDRIQILRRPDLGA